MPRFHYNVQLIQFKTYRFMPRSVSAFAGRFAATAHLVGAAFSSWSRKVNIALPASPISSSVVGPESNGNSRVRRMISTTNACLSSDGSASKASLKPLYSAIVKNWMSNQPELDLCTTSFTQAGLLFGIELMPQDNPAGVRSEERR